MSFSDPNPTFRPLPFTLAVLILACGCQAVDSPTSKTPPPIRVHSDEPARLDLPKSEVDNTTRSIRSVPSRYDRAARYSADRAGVGMLVIEGESIVFSAGQNGESIDAPYPIHNATESFWGVLAIAAEADGLLDLDEPVAFTIGEFAGARWKQDIRIRQLLWYTSGLEAGVWPLTREKPHDQFARALALESVAPPGARFQFGPSHLAIFGELLRRKLVAEGLDAVGYLTRRILDPIGLEVSDWRRDAAGNPDLAEGASLTAAQWAKFGRLLRDRGRWQGEAIIDAADLSECFNGSDVQPSFGLGVWVNPTKSHTPTSAAMDETPLPDFLMAAGSGNQRLFVIPSLDLVVVRFGRAHRDWRDRDFFSQLVSATSASSEPPDSPRETRRFAKDVN